MEIRTDEDILKAVVYVSKYIGQLFPLDCMVSVTNLENFIAYHPGEKIDVKAKIGDPVSNIDVIMHAFNTGKRVIGEVPVEIYGYAFKGVVVPIRNDSGKIIGAFNIGIDLTTQHELLEMSENFASFFEQISSSIQDVAAASQELNNLHQNLKEISETTKQYLINTSEVIQLINDVSSNTKLLGLNASIEAARAGEHGKGFSVVASEIRKLSDRTANSTNEVKEILKKIDSSIDELSKYIERTGSISGTQAAATQEISATVQEIVSVAANLSLKAKIL